MLRLKQIYSSMLSCSGARKDMVYCLFSVRNELVCQEMRAVFDMAAYMPQCLALEYVNGRLNVNDG